MKQIIGIKIEQVHAGRLFVYKILPIINTFFNEIFHYFEVFQTILYKIIFTYMPVYYQLEYNKFKIPFKCI